MKESELGILQSTERCVMSSICREKVKEGKKLRT